MKSNFPQIPSWTIFPEKPQIRANDYECGDVTVYCPAGSWFPKFVQAGYYSYGGGKNNKTKKSKSPKKGPKAHKKSSPTESRRVTRGEKKFLERVMNENNTNMSKKYREERNAEITRREKEKAKNNNNE